METSSADRVVAHTPLPINIRIRRESERSLRWAAADETAIEERLQELDQEWDVERVLFAMTSVNVLFSLLMATAVSRKWLLWTAAVAGFQLQHGAQGWCPPVSLVRRLGVRTRREIERERVALKALRGDFRSLPEQPAAADAGRLLDVAES